MTLTWTPSPPWLSSRYLSLPLVLSSGVIDSVSCRWFVCVSCLFIKTLTPWTCFPTLSGLVTVKVSCHSWHPSLSAAVHGVIFECAWKGLQWCWSIHFLISCLNPCISCALCWVGTHINCRATTAFWWTYPGSSALYTKEIDVSGKGLWCCDGPLGSWLL
jgi:hypothetical protein